mmetsp:Transcript_21167/g.58759  ORF Transcript_21167/g.58759 Transcript_21167/m.58759 type:complete len:126 (-) Transcript_21167:310-687(-)
MIPCCTKVSLTDAGKSELAEAWRSRSHLSLYRTPEQFEAFVLQALSRDIRSVHQRTAAAGQSAPRVPSGAAESSQAEHQGGGSEQPPLYHVVLEGVDVVYRVVGRSEEVVIAGACDTGRDAAGRE